MALHVRLYILVHFFAILCKTTTWIQSVYGEREHPWAYQREVSFLYLNLNAVPTNTAPG